MKECYHNACDNSAYNLTKVTFASMDMLEKVTQTTIDMLLDVSNAKCARTKTFQTEVKFCPFFIKVIICINIKMELFRI